MDNNLDLAPHLSNLLLFPTKIKIHSFLPKNVPAHSSPRPLTQRFFQYDLSLSERNMVTQQTRPFFAGENARSVISSMPKSSSRTSQTFNDRFSSFLFFPFIFGLFQRCADARLFKISVTLPEVYPDHHCAMYLSDND